MDSRVENLYAREIKPLPDDDKLRLLELLARELASRNGGSASLDAAERQAARDRFRRGEFGASWRRR